VIKLSGIQKTTPPLEGDRPSNNIQGFFQPEESISPINSSQQEKQDSFPDKNIVTETNAGDD